MPQPVFTKDVFANINAGHDVECLNFSCNEMLWSVINPLECEDNDKGSCESRCTTRLIYMIVRPKLRSVARMLLACIKMSQLVTSFGINESLANKTSAVFYEAVGHITPDVVFTTVLFGKGNFKIAHKLFKQGLTNCNNRSLNQLTKFEFCLLL